MEATFDTTHGRRPAHSIWHEQVEASADVPSVLTVTRDYLATFGPEHLARLPDDCRPGRIKGDDDIAYWSCKLAQCNYKQSAVRIDADLLQELLTYFLHAWVRISQLHRNAPPPRVH